jgi:hypothetical protein
MVGGDEQGRVRMSDRATSIITGIQKGRQAIEGGLLPGQDGFAVLAVLVRKSVPDATPNEIAEEIVALLRRANDDDDLKSKEFWARLFDHAGIPANEISGTTLQP